jgi:hypothetical protein
MKCIILGAFVESELAHGSIELLRKFFNLFLLILSYSSQRSCMHKIAEDELTGRGCHCQDMNESEYIEYHPMGA